MSQGLNCGSVNLDQSQVLEESKNSRESLDRTILPPQNISSLTLNHSMIDTTEQPQSNPHQFNRGRFIAEGNFSSDSLYKTPGPQDQQTQKISSMEDFEKLLMANMGQDGKVCINGQSFEINFDRLKPQHQFNHQLSSMGSQLTSSTINQDPQQIKNQFLNPIFSDKKIEPQNSNKIQPIAMNSATNNFDISKLKDFRIEQDDLLILSDFEDNFTQVISNNQSTNNNTPLIDNQLTNPQNQNLGTGQITHQCQQVLEEKKLSNKKSSGPKEQEQIILKRHHTEKPVFLSHFIVSQDYSKALNPAPQNQNQTQQQQIENLQKQLNDKVTENMKLKDNINRISQCLAKIYPSLQLLSKDIEDKDLLQVLSQGFVSQAKLHLAFLFSSPLILRYKDETQNGELKSQTIQAIDHNKEFQGVIESLKETGNQIRYRRITATLDNLRIALTENPIALHFSGHGIENNKKNFGKDSLILKDEGNFLIFEDNEGCAQYLSEKKLHELLEASGTKLEFVFVASCYSQFAGEIFHNAGAKHVVCVRKGYQIRDDAAIIFSKNFYHALFSQTVTVCKAFELAKAALSAVKDRALAAEAQKFVLLKDIDEIEKPTPQNNQMPMYNYLMKPKKHKCTVFGPFARGQIENVAYEPMFRLETSSVEDFLGRRKEMQDIISEIFQNRFVTIIGVPGIGKTTTARAIVHYLDERKVFKDGIIVLSLRGLDQTNMMITRLQLLISKFLPQQHEKEEKAVESFTQILDRIISFLKDKEILLYLDNAEDTVRKEGSQFREIMTTLYKNCPRLKMILTSRHAIGFADISEKIYTLKELTPQYSIELLFKKAMRPITDQEIQELLKSAQPTRYNNSNPMRQKKDIVRLDEHHICQLLSGHPHAISLAAPLLQDKTLKELYTLLNSPEIIEWLEVKGIGRTPIASLKLSLDTSIEHMTDQEPQAIKLFCLIGLFPGGCTEEDLNYLWKDGWLMYAEKLLRASLLVKKTSEDGEIRYSLFPFMNQYAVQLMDTETYAKEHKNSCLYLAKVCKEMLRLTQSEIVNRMVQFETNIWACIYRIIDKSHNNNNIQDSIYQRAKSPAVTIRDSQYTNNDGVGKSLYDDSSQGGNSSERMQIDPSTNEDYYDNILSQRRENDYRSRSERMIPKRGILNENNIQFEDNKIAEDEENKTQRSQEVDENEEIIENDPQQSNFDEERGNLSEYGSQKRRKCSYTQPQSLTESQYIDVDDNSNPKQNEHGSVESPADLNRQDLENVYPTQSIANQLSDDQISLLFSTHSQKKMIQSKLKNVQNTDQENNEQDQSDNSSEDSSFNRNLKNNNYLQSEDTLNFNRNSSNDGTYSSNSQNNNSNNLIKRKTNVDLTYQRLQTIPYQASNQYLQNFEEDINTSMILNEQYETSSIDSLQSQLLNMNNNLSNNYSNNTSNFLQDSSFLSKKERRKSVYILGKRKLDEISETFDEDNSIILKDQENQKITNDEIQEDENENMLSQLQREIDIECNPMRKLSSKKYHEDEQFNCQKKVNYIQIPTSNQNVEQYPNDNLSGIDDKNQSDHPKTKKSTHKRVTIQENASSTVKNNQQEEESSKKKSVLRGLNIQNFDPQASLLSLSPEGSLFVYYITNLVIISKYDEALKAIENFGLKLINDQLCIANLKKLQAYIISEISQNYKESVSKYEESLKIFNSLKIFSGQAACAFAIGFLLYTKSYAFITKAMNENKIYDKAVKRIDDAINWYSKVNHYYGQVQCHKIMPFLKKKLGENCAEHEMKQKKLVKMAKQRKNDGKTSYVELNVPKVEVCLFLEVIQQLIPISQADHNVKIKNDEVKTRENQASSILSTKIKEGKKDSSKSAKRQKKEQIKQEEIKQVQNISNVKRQKTPKEDRTQSSTQMSSNEAFSSKNNFQHFNQEFDNLKKNLIESRKSIITSDLADFQEYTQSQSFKQNNGRKQIQQFNQQIASYQNQKLRKSEKTPNTFQKEIFNKEEFKQEENFGHIGIGPTTSVESQNQNKIKDSRKKESLKEQAQQQIKKYKNNRVEALKKAKTQTLSASFIQSKNFEKQEIVSPSASQFNSLKSHWMKKKKENENLVSSQISNVKENSSRNQKLQLAQSEMLFEPASEMTFSRNNSDDELNEQNRFSLQEPSPQTATQQNSSHKKQSLIVPGRLSERPGTSMGISSEPKASFKGKRSTFDPANNNKQSKQLNSSSHRVKPDPKNLPERPISPNNTQKKSQNHSSLKSQTSQLIKANNLVMELSVTTTTKVLIKDNGQLAIDHQPEIMVEQLDEDNSK